jgi:hypothetical protein
VGAGVLLATSRLPRLAAVALIGSIVPTTLAGHRFWEEADDQTRMAQMIQFAKNAGLLGGLVLAVLDTGGAPSLGWRVRRTATDLQHKATDVQQKATGALVSGVQTDRLASLSRPFRRLAPIAG